MVISFTGTGSCGKSTLLQRCKEEFGDRFSYVEEVTRQVKRDYKVPINEQGSNITQILIMNQHVINAIQNPENVIMDRCCIDGIVYTAWLSAQGKVDQWVEDYAANVCEMLIDKLDIIFYCSADFPLVDDGERSANNKFRDDINFLIDNFLRDRNLLSKVVKLSGSVEQRMEVIKQTIQNHGITYTR